MNKLLCLIFSLTEKLIFEGRGIKYVLLSTFTSDTLNGKLAALCYMFFQKKKKMKCPNININNCNVFFT